MTEESSSGPTIRRFDVNRRKFIKYSGASASGTLLAGCNEGGGGASTPVGDFEDYTFKIGVLAPQPEDHIYGRSMVNGVRIAVDEIRADGGILGGDIDVVVGDTEFQPALGRQEHRRLTFDENVDVVIGPMFTSVMLGMMESLGEQETLQFTPATGASMTELIEDDYERFKYAFRASIPNVDVMTNWAMEFFRDKADDFGWDTVALINEDQAAVAEFHRRITDRLPEVVDMPIAKKIVGVKNWGPIFDEVEEVGADLLYLNAVVLGRSIVRQWGNQQRDFELGGFNLFGSLPSYYENLNGTPEYHWSLMLVMAGSSNTEYTQPFTQRYNDRTGEFPVYNAYLCYDAVRMYAQAVEETGSTEEEVLIPHLEGDFLFEESTAVKYVEFQGPDDPYPHDAKYTTIEEMNMPVFFQWQEDDQGNGTQEIFYPPDQQTSEFQKPHWL